MTAILLRSADAGRAPEGISAVAVTGTAFPEPAVHPPLPDLARRLETAFDGIRDDWMSLGRALSRGHNGRLAHAPSCAPYPSDMGVMMAWCRLTEDLANGPDPVLVLCDDPWLFRQLAGIDGVDAGRPPPLVRARIRNAVRGQAARISLAVRAAFTAWRLRGDCRSPPHDAPSILVYGHPGSRPDGSDAYFGDLMNKFMEPVRLLHCDCPLDTATRLRGSSRTVSLQAWGTLANAAALLFTTWRPGQEDTAGNWGWLVRRAASQEAATASAAGTKWQIACQARWLQQVQPSVVLWPWESHPWERALCAEARRRGVLTVGYQHTVVGRHMFNVSLSAQANGVDDLPDRIYCNGPAYADSLKTHGIPKHRLEIAGSFRFSVDRTVTCDPDAEVYVALSNDPQISAEMLTAIRPAVDAGLKFQVRAHPMYPFPVRERPGIRQADRSFAEQIRVRSLLYSTGSSGVEGLLANVPTYRFLPRQKVAMDVLPPDSPVISVDGASVVDALLSTPPAFTDSAPQIVSPPNESLWHATITAPREAIGRLPS